MKKFISQNGLIIISALFLLPLSCTKDKVTDKPNNEVISQLIKVSGEDVNSTTKTTLNGRATSWVAGTDKVGIFSSAARTAAGGGGSAVVNTQFAAASSGARSNFNGTMYWGAVGTSHTFYSYYPYTASASSATNVPVSLPSAQTQSAANNCDHIGSLDFIVANPVTVTSPTSPGTTNGVNFTYNHMFTVLEFHVKGTGNLKTINLQSNEPLAFSSGQIDITQATPTSGVPYTIVNQAGLSHLVATKLTAPAALNTDTDTKVYMVINPCVPTDKCIIGFQVDSDWKYIEKTVPAEGFKRGVKYIVEVNTDDAIKTTVSDMSGNTYNTVTIGTQVWMATNLITTKLNDNTDLSTDIAISWSRLTTPAWTYFYDWKNYVYLNTCGMIYNWTAVNSGKLCPTGWHIPTDTEWTTLINYLGGTDFAGRKIKELGTATWYAESGATNETGFTSLGGGFYDTSFNYYKISTIWWSSSEASSTNANVVFQTWEDNKLKIISQPKDKRGNYVRCIKD